jgi:hypothetical protein
MRTGADYYSGPVWDLAIFLSRLDCAAEERSMNSVDRSGSFSLRRDAALCDVSGPHWGNTEIPVKKLRAVTPGRSNPNGSCKEFEK